MRCDLRLVAVLALAANGGAGAATAGTDCLDLTFSRNTLAAQLSVRAHQVLVLRVDRDLTSLKVEIRPAPGEEAAGPWKARLIALPSTEEADPPDMARFFTGKPYWRGQTSGAQEKPLAVSLPARLPSQVFQNWLLVLDPTITPAGSVELRIAASPVDEQARLRWLIQMRAGFDPEAEPERVRYLAGFLTDAEVRYWLGHPNRKLFKGIWRRMSDIQAREAYPDEQWMQWGDTHDLPGGVDLLSNSRRGSSGR